MPELHLKARIPMSVPDVAQKFAWHDYYVIQHEALPEIVKLLDFAKASLFLSIAAKIENARGEFEDFEFELQELTVKLTKAEARHLWAKLVKLPQETLGRDRFTGQKRAPDLAALYSMYINFAADLGQQMPDVEEDEDKE